MWVSNAATIIVLALMATAAGNETQRSDRPQLSFNGSQVTVEGTVINLTAISSVQPPATIECSVISRGGQAARLSFWLWSRPHKRTSVLFTELKLVMPAEVIKLPGGSINTTIRVTVNDARLMPGHDLGCYSYSDHKEGGKFPWWIPSTGICIVGKYEGEAAPVSPTATTGPDVHAKCICTPNVVILGAVGGAATSLLIILAILVAVHLVKKRRKRTAAAHTTTTTTTTTITTDNCAMPHPAFIASQTLISTNRHPERLQVGQLPQNGMGDSLAFLRAATNSRETTSSTDGDGYLLPSTIAHFSRKAANQKKVGATDDNTYQEIDHGDDNNYLLLF